jgi:hypothetical protein
MTLFFNPADYFYTPYVGPLNDNRELTFIALKTVLEMLIVFFALKRLSPSKNVPMLTGIPNNLVISILGVISIIGHFAIYMSMQERGMIRGTVTSTGDVNIVNFIFNLLCVDIISFFMLWLLVFKRRYLSFLNKLLALISVMALAMGGLNFGIKGIGFVFLVFIVLATLRRRKLFNIRIIIWLLICILIASTAHIYGFIRLRESQGFFDDITLMNSIFNPSAQTETIFGSSRRLAGIDSVYLIQNMPSSTERDILFSPATFFSDRFWEIMPGVLHSFFGKTDWEGLGHRYAVVFGGAASGQIIGMEPSMIGLMHAYFPWFLAPVAMTLLLLVLDRFWRFTTNEFQRDFLTLAYWMFFMSGVTKHLINSILGIIIVGFIIKFITALVKVRPVPFIDVKLRNLE